ncbi:MAG TPA: GAF domain-containing sensor histidine kinase, partial [Polyangiaceae bacterium]|nr:GAF domain-containing sensor histidine kinase [Polyangiaceae bacterium]
MTDTLGATLHDVVRTLESTRGSESRAVRVLELLRRIVPYELCALFHTPPGREPRLLLAPACSLDARQGIAATAAYIHELLVDERSRSLEAQTNRWGTDLAVPLIGDDRVIGVLLVRGAPRNPVGGYTEHHLRNLSIVGAQLAGYLVLVEMASALEERRREAETANRLKDVFLALVSRAQKTTLLSTLAWARILRSETLDPTEHCRAVQAIERNAHTQAKRIDELLDLSCLMVADPHLDLELVQPARLIEAAVDEQRPRAERKAIRVETVAEESMPPVLVDAARIVRVISNLLANAIQFTPHGGGVAVHLARAGLNVRIQVIDHGNGIPPEELAHVFDAFRAGRNPQVTTYGELGGGLAIVKPLVEAHGGAVRAESPGDQRGSILTIELPLQAEAPNAADRPLAGIRVLLVDDDVEMRVAAALVLELFGAQVTAVA